MSKNWESAQAILKEGAEKVDKGGGVYTWEAYVSFTIGAVVCYLLKDIAEAIRETKNSKS